MLCKADNASPNYSQIYIIVKNPFGLSLDKAYPKLTSSF